MNHHASVRSRYAIALLIVPLSLSACSSSGVNGVDNASQDQVRTIRVSEVNVTIDTPKPNPLLQAALKDEL